MVLMYATEVATIVLMVLWFRSQRTELLIFSLMFLMITCTEHVLYLLAHVYELLKAINISGVAKALAKMGRGDIWEAVREKYSY